MSESSLLPLAVSLRDAEGFYRIQDRRRTTEEVQAVASGYLTLAAKNQRLREAIAEAMTSLSTGPMKDGYAYSVLEEATGDA